MTILFEDLNVAMKDRLIVNEELLVSEYKIDGLSICTFSY